MVELPTGTPAPLNRSKQIDESPPTGTVVSYVRYADGTLLEVLTATPNEGGRFGRKKWIHVVKVVKK